MRSHGFRASILLPSILTASSVADPDSKGLRAKRTPKVLLAQGSQLEAGSQIRKGRRRRPFGLSVSLSYRVDSISKPQASSNGSGMYFEFLFRRAHSRSRVDRKYWSGESLYSWTTCSNSVIVGVTGPIGSGLPQLGFPRRLAMKNIPSRYE